MKKMITIYIVALIFISCLVIITFESLLKEKRDSFYHAKAINTRDSTPECAWTTQVETTETVVWNPVYTRIAERDLLRQISAKLDTLIAQKRGAQ